MFDAPKVGDFMVCSCSFQDADIFRAVVLEVHPMYFVTCVYYCAEESGPKPLEIWDCSKADWRFMNSPTRRHGTSWRIERGA